MDKGIVFNIQRYTINDGPGIRTEFFLKGCPLKCPWCSNPEGQNPQREPGVYSSRCISERKCGLCVKSCGQRALLFGEDRIVGIDRTQCIGCLQCAEACPAEAIKPWGQSITLDEAMDIIRRDLNFYERSGGGVTLSGGEPLVQHAFTRSLLRRCKEEGIHTCLESTFHANWEIIETVLPYADLLISDIKHMDSELHKTYTGVGNEKILENLSRIAAAGCDMILRIPVILGINDDMGNIEKAADYILAHIGDRLNTLQLLSFMRMGEEKCISLDRPYEMKGLEFDREEFQTHVNAIGSYFNSRGIPCVVGTKETNHGKAVQNDNI